MMAQDRVDQVVVEQAIWHLQIDPERRPAALIGVKTSGRCPAGQGATNIEEIPVSGRPRPQHRVGEDDRIGLTPGDLVAEYGALGQLIGGTRPTR